jgi:ABC-type phosphate transport system substrate-binding protein
MSRPWKRTAAPGPHLRYPFALLLLALAAAPLSGAPRAAAGDFMVVVNAANPQQSMPAAEISRLFLRKSTLWGSGERVMAVDLLEDSPVREKFSKAIHERSASAVKAYWQKMIFSGRDVPPPEKYSVAEVLAYVRANSGAIGYVADDTPLPPGVKVLKVAP